MAGRLRGIAVENSMNGRRVLVVGASTGIGRAIATTAIHRGAEVVFAARRAELLDEAVAQAGGGYVVVGDSTTSEGCQAIADKAAASVGQLDLVVYAAGMSTIRPIELWTADEWRNVLFTNVVGASLMTAACLPHLSKIAIVGYLSSDSAFKPRHSLTPYAASKAALEVTIKGWRVEHPDHRFVNVIVGPTTDTDFGANFDMDLMMATVPVWLAHGDIQIKSMTSPALAAVLLTSLGAALAHPEIDMQELVLRPPGPLATTFEDLIAAAAATANHA